MKSNKGRTDVQFINADANGGEEELDGSKQRRQRAEAEGDFVDQQHRGGAY